MRVGPLLVGMGHGATCACRMGGECDCRVADDVMSKKPDTPLVIVVDPPAKPIRDQLEHELNKAFNWHTSERIMALLEIFIEEKMRGN